MPSTVNFGEKTFLALAPSLQAKASPFGATISRGEMNLALAALAVDGFSKGDAQTLATTFADAKMTREARKLFVASTQDVVTGTNVKPGTTLALKGTIVELPIRMGIGGEAPPGGPALKLSSPITVNGTTYDTVILGEGAPFKAGSELTLNGRVDLRKWGGVETRGGSYIAFSGVSNLTAGEPAFTGRGFTDASGKALSNLAWNRPLMLDGPAKIWVLSADGKRAFHGSMGGMMPPEMNPFHGFQGSSPVVAPTAQELKTLTSAGRDQELIATDGSPKAWYYDEAAGLAFHFSGTKIDKVIRNVK